MTITALELVYFEGHEGTLLEFDPGVNIITGLSGHGKSSLVRGFNWVLTNQPMGESMISHFAGENDTVSSIEFEEGSYIVRTRGNKENSYVDSSNEDPYKALRGKVPDSVSLISNMDDTNVQRQKDFYFMLNDSPGQVARMFNKVSGLDEMDYAQTEINIRYKKKKKEMDVLSSRHGAIEEKLSDTSWIVEADERYSIIEMYEKEEKELIGEIVFLDNAIASIEVIEEEIASLLDPGIIERIDTIFTVEEEVIEVEEEIDKLQNLLESSSLLENEIRNIRLPEEGRIDEIEDVIREIEEIDDSISRINLLIQYCANYEADIVDAEGELIILKNKYKDVLSTFDICPICERKL